MGKNPPKVVVDTNVLISAILFGGNPRKILKLLAQHQISGITSPILIVELMEILSKKFKFEAVKIILIDELIKEEFTIVYPSLHLEVLRDSDDDRVLEAAIEGQAEYIVTGDRDLLELKKYQNVGIVTPAEFLLRIKG